MADANPALQVPRLIAQESGNSRGGEFPLKSSARCNNDKTAPRGATGTGSLMSTDVDKVLEAADLMRRALALLDGAGEREAAAHIQMAYDTIQPKIAQKPELATESPALALDPAAVRALGGTFALFASLLERNGSIPRGEVGELLALYATATAEADQREGDLVACWAGMLRDIAQSGR